MKDILITCHNNADWDALASMLGMTSIYPDAYLVFPGSMEKNLNQCFNDIVVHLYHFKNAKDIDPKQIGKLVIVDTNQLARLSHVQEILEHPDIIIEVWDHHQELEHTLPIKYHGTVGSTCTLIARELEARQIIPNCENATFLGLGIYGDTGAFTYSSTTPEDYLAAAWLRQHGLDLDFVSTMIQHDLSSAHVKALGALLESATIHSLGAYSVVLAEVTLDSFLGDFAYVTQRFMEMENCHILFALASMDNKIQIVARSRIPELDVGIICKTFGGGGHPFAASASVKSIPMPELKDAIFQQLYAQIHPHKRAKDLMSSPVVGIYEHQNMRQAEIIMNRYGLKAAPIFKTGTQICVGLLECQTAAKASDHGLGQILVSEYMQRNPVMVTEDTSLQELMDIIVGAHQRLVPILKSTAPEAEREIIGVVTRTDLIHMFLESPEKITASPSKEKDITKLLESRLPMPFLNILKQAGELGDSLAYNVYAVGGFVRDLILSRPTSNCDDIDLVVEGNGIAFAHALAKQLNGRVREHPTFMTAVIIYQNSQGQKQRVDVATARLEYYKYPAALPTVELSSIKMDLFRRDFTINAMALRLNVNRFGRLVDFFAGQQDLQRKTIQIIHALSFVEDPTRIIRAVRFEQRYNFKISQQSEKLIRNAISLDLINKLSGQRLIHELNLIFNELSPQNCLVRLNDLGVLAAIHPALGLNADKLELLSSLREVVQWYNLLYLPEKLHLQTLYFLALSSGLNADDTTEILQRLDTQTSFNTNFLTLRAHLRSILPIFLNWKHSQHKLSISQFCSLLQPLSLDAAIYLMARTPQEGRSNISQYIYNWKHIKPEVTGQNLVQMGLEPGPAYGRILRKVLSDKLDFNISQEEQLALAQKLVKQELNNKGGKNRNGQ